MELKCARPLASDFLKPAIADQNCAAEHLHSRLDNPKRLLSAGVLVLWIGGVCFRLVQMQVLQYGEWEQRALRQQSRTITVEPRRGVIYDRNGSELAMSIDVDSIFAVPSEIPEPETTASILGNVLHLDPQEIVARMKASRNFAWVLRRVDAETSERVRDLNLKGIYFRKEPKRFYPKRELASQVLGYVGMDDDGLGGIEQEFNDDLAGIPGPRIDLGGCAPQVVWPG